MTLNVGRGKRKQMGMIRYHHELSWTNGEESMDWIYTNYNRILWSSMQLLDCKSDVCEF